VTPEEHLAGHELALAVYRRVHAVLLAHGPTTVRVSASQISFRRRRAFAWLWLPGRYVAHPTAAVVLTFALGREDPSPRIKEVAHPTPRVWVHHLEVHGVADIDPQVVAWLDEAADAAGWARSGAAAEGG
jgi:uncharacterized protein DUF5655